MGYGLKYMKTVSVFYVLMGFMFGGEMAWLPGGWDMGAFMLSSISNLVTRVVIAYLLAYFIGSSAIWWSIPIGWGIGSIFSFLRIRSGKWKARKLLEN